MAGSRRRRKKVGIAKAAPDEQIARLAQRSFVNAKQADRTEPVRVAVPVGTLDDGAIALVDPAGMVQLTGRNWALDWWVGSEDGWHFASSDPTVAQTLVGFSPVVRTTIHVPGGNIIHRCFGTRATVGTTDSTDTTAAVVVEIENQSAVPVALALVVRPVTLWGDGQVQSLRSEGQTVSVDGSVALVMSRPVARRVVGPPGTVAIRLDLEDDESPDGSWSVDDQMAEGAFIIPLPHTAVARILLPADSLDLGSVGLSPSQGQASGGTTGSDSADLVISGWEAPSSEQVEKGWKSVSKDMVSISSPEPILDGLCAASQRFLSIVGHDSFFDSVDGYSAALRNAVLTETLVTTSARTALEPIAKALVESERLRGGIRMDDRSDASVALVHCASLLLTGPRSVHWEEMLLGPVAKAIHRMGKGSGLGSRETGGDPAAERVLVDSAALAVTRIAPALLSIGQPEVAMAAHDLYHSLTQRTVPAQSQDSGDTGSAQSARSSLGRSISLRHLVGSADPQATRAAVELCDLGHLGVLAEAYDGTVVAVDSAPYDSAATALRLGSVIDLFVTETPSSIDLLSCWDPLWFGKPVEVSNVRTRLGVVSYALRWSENRPILLWEVEPAVGLDPKSVEPLITSSGLDESWHGHGWRGESILGTVEISQEVRDRIAERDRPKLAVSLGMKPAKKR